MFWRSNLTLQIEPTHRCNLNCKICMRRNLDVPESPLSLGDFKKVLRSGNFRYVGLHGWGEPLLNPQLFQMVEYAESEGVYTNLTTNGTLIEENIDKIFSSGLRGIAFGIYRKELLLTILPQIESLIRERNKQGLEIPKIYMDITIYKENVNQIPDLVKLAHELGIDAAVLHRLFNAYKVDPSVEYISIEEEKELFREVKRLARQWNLRLYLPRKHSLPCEVVKRSIFVTVEGKVTPCCFLPQFHVGDAFNEGITEVMHSEAYTNFVRAMKRHPVCNKCRW